MYKIKIISFGPGNPVLLTEQAHNAINECEIIYGSKRLLLFIDNKIERKILTGNLNHSLDEIIATFRQKQVGVLVTGDSGFHSFANNIVKRAGRQNCAVYCGISAMQYAFNKLMIPWEDAYFINLHKSTQTDLAPILNQYDKIGILTRDENTCRRIFAQMDKDLIRKKRIFILENLSYENENFVELTPDNILDYTSTKLNIIIILNENIY